MKSNDVELRSRFVAVASGLVDLSDSGKVQAASVTGTWLVTHCLNQVRRTLGQDPVRKSLNDLYISLEKDIPEEDLQPGDLVFFETVGPRELFNVEVIVKGRETIGVANSRVQRFGSFKRSLGFTVQWHFRSIGKWLVRSTDIVRIRTTFRGFRAAHTFFITNGNNSSLVQSTLEAWGWKRTQTAQSSGLIWTQMSKQVDFESSKEGTQLVNHLPRLHALFTTKKSMRHTTKQIPNFPIPLTFDLSDQFDYAAFMQYAESGAKWILKPFALNQGIGITLVTNAAQFKRDLQSGKESRAKVIQLYIERPLLLSGCKFDIRFYLLIARCKPLVLLRYEQYYIRRSLNKYSLSSTNLLTHLTNAHQQKSHPDFQKRKEESIWSKQQFQEKLGQAFTDKIERGMIETLARLMAHVVSRVEQRLGCFELLGVDFMLDDDHRLYLLEANINPAIYTDTRVLSNVIPRLISDTLSVVKRLHEGDSGYLSNTYYKPLLPLP